MRKTMYVFLALGLAFLLLWMNCSAVADAVVDGAVGGLSRAASERAANAVYKKLAPKEKLPPPATPGWNQFMVMQAQIVFLYAFSPGGLWVSTDEFQPGEYAKFKIEEDGNESDATIEKAFLKRLDNGNEWWRATWGDDEDVWIYEALLSPEEGRLLRLRAKDANGNEGEVPVSEGTVYSEPTEVTEESIEGAKIGEATITTPVGTFNTDHIQYVATTNEGTTEWWLTPEVPGGVIKYQMKDDQEVVWTSTMIQKGDDATTVLNSF